MLRTSRFLLAALTVICAGCTDAGPRGATRSRLGSGDSATDSAQQAFAASTHVDLTGGGASFPYPLYARWFNEYAPIARVRINYRAESSGEGIRHVINRSADFGATDVPMSDAQMRRVGAQVLHIPTAVGAVGITYNLPTIARPLRLSPAVIADLFLGRIGRWNDPRLQALNPDVKLPSDSVVVVVRDDDSGTSYIFSDYLSAVSADWVRIAGRGSTVDWPVGRGAHGNEGVAGEVKQTVGAVGYLETVYGRQNRLPLAHVQNRAGRFVSPMPFEVASAASATLEGLSRDRAAAAPPDYRLSLVDAPGAQSYPIASFTWIVFSPTVLGNPRTRQLVDFLHWALRDGSTITSTMGYVTLPAAATEDVLRRLDGLLDNSER
ncbi:MAG: phosphate ABC transporter substrate-binding protein PstS [Gemmatimonadaceae bacterium]|nr:phosphate ABC transporter substrate-binding protein PstS [Gemmatimonadaceae bacterium]